MAEVEKERARSVRRVGCELAGEALADVVLGQQEVRQPAVSVGLLLPQPEQLGRLEPGQRGVARDLQQPFGAHPGGDLAALRLRPLVVPEQRRADRLPGTVEEDRAVHLAAQADPDDPPVHRASDLAEGFARRPPPGLGVLLGPARMRHGEGIATAGGRDPLPIAADGERPDAGRADVEADQDVSRQA